ncbi:cupin domain-containing protein [Microbacterium sp. USHLN186]|uniref:cupin domain-containing protein n=1 Tax=Microbacterium sp. USHLN186 TaxID=3081286 RepID=UPI003015EAE6
MSVFPGGVALSDLEVYDWEAEDGCRGGSPHLHTASSEGYVVIGGTGGVQTLSAAGFAEHPLATGDVLWFTPGTVHRLINDGDLRLLVVMSNAGLPEAGDAVLTFPPHVLDDPDAYAAAARLPDGAERAEAARARRDLAVRGFAALRDAGPDAVSELHRQAVKLVQPKVAGWQTLWRSTVLAETERTARRLALLASGDERALADAQVSRVASTSTERGHGMCGMLRAWEWS